MSAIVDKEHQLFPHEYLFYRSLPLEWLDHIWYPEPVIINAKKIEWSEGAMPEKFLNLLQGNMLNYWVK